MSELRLIRARCQDPSALRLRGVVKPRPGPAERTNGISEGDGRTASSEDGLGGGIDGQ